MSELDDIREASSLKAKHKTAMDASKNAKKQYMTDHYNKMDGNEETKTEQIRIDYTFEEIKEEVEFSQSSDSSVESYDSNGQKTLGRQPLTSVIIAQRLQGKPYFDAIV